MTGLTQPLVDLLENPGIIKVGLSLKDDFMMLHKRAPFNQQSCIELLVFYLSDSIKCSSFFSSGAIS